jgi:hypothetical protein
MGGLAKAKAPKKAKNIKVDTAVQHGMCLSGGMFLSA